ncbi:hypothetical protein Q4Q35_19595 [Flavivirga aquimarina]|uniref:Uncharacterized protein n=1 Tax=Flavivirga aquimarina TaxID=2027862 RepID=A0ABT8WG90_9FLAO|nr:hypothetical protein [Flavivirga aquimarina]MDO5972011.1 hypothetical protein [Flavivirga aquimarina]
MTLYEFNILSFKEKQATVYDIGVFLYNYLTTDIRIPFNYGLALFFFLYENQVV